jgi:transmembrane sensor
MQADNLENLTVEEQAAYWLRVMQNPSAEEREAFWGWINVSPRHVRELLLAGKLDQELESFDRVRHIDVDALLAKRVQHERPKESILQQLAPRWVAGMAACMGIVAVAIVLTHVFIASRGTYVTGRGEQRLVDLEDGSVVFLNTQSKVKVDYTAQGRDIYLRDGQALFQVRHEATRPFRVHTGTAVIQAIGTRFDVRVFTDRTTIAVVEGTVQVLTPTQTAAFRPASSTSLPSPPRITAGEGATIDSGGTVQQPSLIDANAAIAWSQQRLVFTDETLGHIAEEFNRYNAKPRIRIEGELSEKRFNGVFAAHNPSALLSYLKQDPSVQLDDEGDEIVIRSR